MPPHVFDEVRGIFEWPKGYTVERFATRSLIDPPTAMKGWERSG